VTKAQFRTRVLTTMGRSWPARAWARGRCKASGVQVCKVGDAIELRKASVAIRLAPKHIFLAPEVCGAFDFFALGLPVVEQEGSNVIDFAGQPDIFNQCRICMSQGVVLEHRGSEIWLHKDDRAMVLALQHLVYAGDLAASFEIYFVPLVPQEREGLKVLDYSRPGNLQRYAKSGLEFEMASFPEEEEAIEEYFKWYKPKAGDLVFDMGAHCGVSTYHLSKLVGDEGRVVCFEPDPVNFEILMRNIRRHGLTNVVAENAAIAGSAGQLAFNSEGTIGSSLVSLLQRESVGSVVMVDAVTLGDVFERWGLPAFCKVDIEGAEVDVLANSGELLQRHKTNFALDTNHPKANGEMTSKDVESFFRNYGYETASEANPLLTTWARPL
jgi:FkbM family methyltransferase